MQTFPNTLKALFLDMDETLCDTTGANNKALEKMATLAQTLLGQTFDGIAFSHAYLKGIYRELSPAYQAKLLPIAEDSEEAFRHALIEAIFKDMGENLDPARSIAYAKKLQRCFDDARTEYFDFYDGIVEWLAHMRESYTLVVITNGPEFSQVTKVERVNLKAHVDHIIIGGQEPEQKPHKSIFDKALRLANCTANEAIHIGDSLSADIKGALNAGIHSIWIQHGQEPSPDIQADWVVKLPFDVEPLLNNILAN